MASRIDLIRWLESQVGYTEGANNYNKYAPMVEGAISWNAQNQPWCSIFVVAAFTQVFGNQLGCKLMCTNYGQASAACEANASCYQSHNQYFGSPQVGDQIFFYYSGGINHTGVVVAIEDGIVVTIEGNSGDAVKKNRYRISDPIIAGYGRPDWSLTDSESSADEPEDAPISDELLPDNIKGVGIAMLQGGLKYLGYDVGRFRDNQGIKSGIDGDAGGQESQTNNALRKAVVAGLITKEQVNVLLSWCKT